jgi:hypothetical protein
MANRHDEEESMFTRTGTAATLLALLAMSVGCAGPATEISQVWYDPSYGAGPVEKVLVIGILRDPARARFLEDTLASQLGTFGVEAVGSSEIITEDEAEEDGILTRVVNEHGFDSILFARLVDVEKRAEYVPGYTYVDDSWGSPYGTYYSSAYSVVHEPGYTVERTVASVETTVYDVDTDAPIWSAVSETVDPKDLNRAIEEFGLVIIGALQERGLVEGQVTQFLGAPKMP